MSVAAPFRRTIEDIAENAGDVIIIIIGIVIFYALFTIGGKLWSGLQGLFSGIQGLSLGGGAGGGAEGVTYGALPTTSGAPGLLGNIQEAGYYTNPITGWPTLLAQYVAGTKAPTGPTGPIGGPAPINYQSVYPYTPAGIQANYNIPGGVVFTVAPNVVVPPSYLSYVPQALPGAPGIVGPATPVYYSLPGAAPGAKAPIITMGKI